MGNRIIVYPLLAAHLRFRIYCYRAALLPAFITNVELRMHCDCFSISAKPAVTQKQSLNRARQALSRSRQPNSSASQDANNRYSLTGIIYLKRERFFFSPGRETYKLNVSVTSPGVDSPKDASTSGGCKSSLPEGRGLVIGRWTCYPCLAKIDDRVRRRVGRTRLVLKWWRLPSLRRGGAVRTISSRREKIICPISNGDGGTTKKLPRPSGERRRPRIVHRSDDIHAGSW